jgi:tellurite methyltransferase
MPEPGQAVNSDELAYDEGYAACACFWGSTPGSLVRALEQYVPDFSGLQVLDAGCGEGKNAVYLASRGAQVDAFDASALAIRNGRSSFGSAPHVRWSVEDVRTRTLCPDAYDVVIAYGLLHCLSGRAEVLSVARKLQRATRLGGYMLVCAMNGRLQDMRAHRGFTPTFLSHGDYCKLFEGWELLLASDEDLVETHPHNMIPHAHSMTRILARKYAR